MPTQGKADQAGRTDWRSPGTKHQRRVDLMVTIGSVLLIASAAVWATMFTIRGLWGGVGMELWLVGTGIVAMVLGRRGQSQKAGLLLLVTLLIMLCGICLVLDVPSAHIKRSSHHLLPALGACAFLLLRGRHPILRHGMTSAFMAAFIFLDVSSFRLTDAYVLPDDIRAFNAWGNDLLAMATLYMALVVIQADVTARNGLEGDLRNALIARQLVLHYQPQVDDSGRVIGAEALVRWQHPRHGLVSPGDFIPLAEETGLILPLGDWVLKEACTQIAIWKRYPALASLTVAVNVSAHQFREPDFVAQVLSIVERSGIDPTRLKLELTETMLVNDLDDIIAKMKALRARGLSFSMDDFGTGFSSLSSLKRLPLDQLKIDQAFVRDLLTNPNDVAIAKTVVSLGQNLGLDVIAEGVETEGQRDFLLSIGCHRFQGYLFSRPLPLRAFEVHVTGLADLPALR